MGAHPTQEVTPVPRITIRLEHDEVDALVQLAVAERRDPAAQAAWLVARALPIRETVRYSGNAARLSMCTAQDKHGAELAERMAVGNRGRAVRVALRTVGCPSEQEVSRRDIVARA